MAYVVVLRAVNTAFRARMSDPSRRSLNFVENTNQISTLTIFCRLHMRRLRRIDDQSNRQKGQHRRPYVSVLGAVTVAQCYYDDCPKF